MMNITDHLDRFVTYRCGVCGKTVQWDATSTYTLNTMCGHPELCCMVQMDRLYTIIEIHNDIERFDALERTKGIRLDDQQAS